MLLEKDDKTKIYFKHHLEELRGYKIKGPHILDYIEDLYEIEEILSKEDDLIIVTKDSLISIKNLLKMQFTQLLCKCVNIHNYLYNILKNKLVPKHEIINENRKKEIAEEYIVVNHNGQKYLDLIQQQWQ